MSNAKAKLDQIELDRQKDAEIRALRQRHACHKCQIQGVKPAQGECSHCGGDGIEPDRKEEYKRELKDIEERYAL